MLLAAVVAGLRHAALPFTGATPPKGLGIAGSGDAIAVAEALVRALQSHPALLLEAVVLAAAAVAIPHVRARGPWWIAGLGAALIAAALAACSRRRGRSARARGLGHLHRPGPQGPGLEFRRGA